MGPEKTRAVVLRVIPYRESSYLVHLFSERHGLLHGIVKGLRRGKPAGFLERGLLVELLASVRPHRELHTISSVQIVEFFPAVRSDLLKTTLRDAAFEMILKTITLSDPHPELFALFTSFLHELQALPASRCFPLTLWRFYLTFATLLGFDLNLAACVDCGSPPSCGGTLLAARGAVRCVRCGDAGGGSFLSAEAIAALTGAVVDSPETPAIGPAEARRITRLLAAYCSYHFDVGPELKALAFLDELAGG